jgi:osmotically-inducible protein OsmY
MPQLIRSGIAALIACSALGLAGGLAQAQTQPERADAPATEAKSPNDAAIADRVSEALKADPHNFYRHATVSVTNGVVRLGGMVYSTDAMQKAEKIARQTPGVSSVENKMQLEREGPNTPGH